MSGEADESRIVRLLEIEFEYLQKSLDNFDNSRCTIRNLVLRPVKQVLPLSALGPSWLSLIWKRYISICRILWRPGCD